MMIDELHFGSLVVDCLQALEVPLFCEAGKLVASALWRGTY